MAQRIQKRDIARRLAARMNTDEAAASQWLDATIDTLYEAFQAGESVTLEGLGRFYVPSNPEKLKTAWPVSRARPSMPPCCNPTRYAPVTCFPCCFSLMDGWTSMRR